MELAGEPAMPEPLLQLALVQAKAVRPAQTSCAVLCTELARSSSVELNSAAPLLLQSMSRSWIRR